MEKEQLIQKIEEEQGALVGLEGVAYFEKLANIIIPLQRELRDLSLRGDVPPPSKESKLSEEDQKIFLDTEKRVLQFGESLIQLSLSEFPLIECLYRHLGQSVRPKELREALAKSGFTSKPSWVLNGLEGRYGKPIFGRTGLASGMKYYLGTLQPQTPDLPSPKESRRRKQAPGALEIKSKEETDITTITSVSLTNLIIGLVPEEIARSWSVRGSLSLTSYQTQAKNLADFILEVKEGGIKQTPLPDLIDAGESEKTVMTQGLLRVKLAELLISFPDRSLEEFHHRWGVVARRILGYLGMRTEILLEAINSLPEVERALVLRVSSLALLEDLGYVDLEDCDEIRFAMYLRNAAFDKNQNNRDDNFERLVIAAMERDGEGTLNLYEVLENIAKPPYRQLIFDRMIDSAYYGSFRSDLMAFFASHPETHSLAIELENKLISQDLIRDFNIIKD